MALSADLVIVPPPLPALARIRPRSRPDLRVGLVQERWREDADEHRAALAGGIAAAADAGARAVFLQELTLSRYFANEEDPLAIVASPEPLGAGPTVAFARDAAQRHRIHVHASLWEQASEGRRFNTAVLVAPDGNIAGITRKFHIPHFPGYHEHRYFEPGDSPVEAIPLGPANVGLPTCWDQWFPELSRTFALKGADVLVYPTAIGSEPLHPDWDTRPMWQAAMVGQAITNGLFVLAVNRTGREGELTFYGSSFVCDPYGRILAQAPADTPAVIVVDLDLDARRDWLDAFPMLDDRRLEVYSA